MTAPDEHVDLVGLVRGELDTAYVALARLHLDGCGECRAELVDVVAGHALLGRTAMTLDAGARPPRQRTDETLPELPSPRARWARVPVLVAAACLALVAILVGVLRPGDDPETTPPVAEAVSATLEPLGATGGGSVEMTGVEGESTRMVFEVHDLPALSDGQFYYAWLLDPATNKMLPLGQVGTSSDASFDVPDGLVDAYSAIDVSLEDDDGDPQHSPTSVLRASYP